MKFKSYAFFLGIALILRWGAVEAYVIPSGSMLPSLLINDHIFVNKATYGLRVPFTQNWLFQTRIPSRGEVIVFRSPEPEGITLIKRVIAVPGDKVEYDGKNLRINDQLVQAKNAYHEHFEDIDDIELENQKTNHEHLVEELNGKHHSIIRKLNDGGPAIEKFVVPADRLFVMGDHRDNSKDSRYWGLVSTDNLLGKAEFVWMSCERALPVVKMFCDPTAMRWQRIGESVN